MPKKKNWSKAKSNSKAFAANMGAPVQRRSRKVKTGMGKKK